MDTRTIGIIMNGVTGRMGTNQHLIRSVQAIIEQGGVKVSDHLTLMPEPILTGRNQDKLRALAARTGFENYTTDIDAALSDDAYEVFFDASSTLHRARFVEKAVAAGKAVYCEKPTAVTTDEALRLAELAEGAGLKNGVVQDKLWLPGLRKFLTLKDDGFFGRIHAVHGEFGYWVFTGHDRDQPAQRPSWNYRKEDGGGMLVDMLCHWRYVIDNLFSDIRALTCLGATHIPERIDEDGRPYACTAEDSAYVTFALSDGTVAHFNNSWCTRVRRDDLLTMHVDGSKGSAVVGLRSCWVQPAATTPVVLWNPDLEDPADYYQDWQEVPDACTYDNAFKAQWELFLRHVALDEPFSWTLREGAKGVQLAELGMQSWRERRWIDVPEL